MKTRVVRVMWACVAALVAVPASVLAAPLASPITYQGELNLNGAPVNNTADFVFRLFDAAVAGNPESALVPALNVQVLDGVFTVSLDFGFDVFQANEQRFMEIQVRSPAGAGAFTTLTPRQALTPSPVASAARRGFVPWVVQTPGMDESITLSPDLLSGEPLVSVVRDGAQVAAIEQSGPLGGGVFRASSEETGQMTAFWGTSFSDQSGFASLVTKDFFVENIRLDADIDGDANNGLADARISIRSVGTGGAGGNLVLENNEGTRTLDMLGGGDDGTASLRLLDLDGSTLFDLSPNAGTDGTQIFGFNSAGEEQYRLEPDNNADGGGFFAVQSGTMSNNVCLIDGNTGNSGSPLLAMFGSSNFTVDASASGNNAVQTTNDAISAPEMLDEAGIANIQDSSVALTTTNSSILSRTITVPAAGFVLAMAQGDLSITHVTGGSSFATWGVNDTAGIIPVNGDISYFVPSALPSSTYQCPASAHAVFSVAAGAHTFHFNAFEFGAEATMFDPQLTLIYFPTAYGTTEPSLSLSGLHSDGDDAPAFMPLTEAEMLAERAEGEAFHNYRIQKELTDLKAEVEALKAMMRNDPNMQPQPAERRAPIVQPTGDAGPRAAAPHAGTTSSEQTAKN